MTKTRITRKTIILITSLRRELNYYFCSRDLNKENLNDSNRIVLWLATVLCQRSCCFLFLRLRDIYMLQLPPKSRTGY